MRLASDLYAMGSARRLIRSMSAISNAISIGLSITPIYRDASMTSTVKTVFRIRSTWTILKNTITAAT